MTTFSMKQGLRIGTWNVRSLLEPTKLSQLCKEFQRYRLLLLGLCEIRWADSGEITTTTGHKLLFSGNHASQRRENGVGFLLSKPAADALIEWKAHSDRIISIRLRTRARKMTVVQCYAPTNVADMGAKDAFYSSLAKTMSDIPKGDIVILMGDMNAQVGTSNRGRERTMGQHGLGTLTENGQLFTELCTDHNLVIGGTLFCHKRIHKATWTSPDRVTENQIDHIAISNKWRGSLLDVRNKRGADVASDHHLLTATVRLRVAAAAKNSNQKSQKKFDVEKLKNPTTRARFSESLASAFSEHACTDDWQQIKQIFVKSAENHIGHKVNKRKCWISDRTWDLINDRRKVKNQLNCAKTRQCKAALQQRYSAADKQIKRSAREDKRNYSNHLAATAQAAAETHRTRDLYRTLRQLTNTAFKTAKPLKDENGVLTTSKDQQILIWERYYKKLLSAPSAQPVQPCSCQRHIVRRDISTTCPDEPEIISAIKTLKNNKAPGPDNINPELLKADPELSARILLPLLNSIWSSEKIPSELKEGIVTLLPKKGNLSECKNWRGITLLSMINKVIAHIIHKRLSNSLLQGLRKEQAGFRPHCACVDHVNTLRVIAEQSVEWRTPLYLCFIDFEKAFDTLKHEAIWKALACKGVPEKIINIIKELYAGACCRVKHENVLSNGVEVQTGVRQGCVLSPLLFNLVLDLVMRQACAANRGITWGMCGHLEDLDYADDICLLSHKYSHISAKLHAVSEAAAQTGLKINIAKTKVMRINTSESQALQIAGTPLEDVDEFCYLGSIISKTGGSAADIRNRISKGCAAFGMLDKVWRASHISRHTKLKIFNANVKSVVLYGCETWNISACVLQSLQAFLNRCLRKIMRIYWPQVISNADLWIMTKQTPVHIEIQRRKWKWIGHTLRKPHDDITRTALDWNPQGSRRRGRPANTWRRQVDAEASKAGRAWNEIKCLALDKINYNLFIETLCSI